MTTSTTTNPKSHGRARLGSIGIAAATALMFMLAGCGGDGDDSSDADEVASLGDDGERGSPGSAEASSDAPTDPDEAMLAYTDCMRDHGIDMPDPVTAEGEGPTVNYEFNENDGSSGRSGPDPEKFEAAEKACSPLLANVERDIERDPEREAELREQMLDYAACMRAEGVDMPDPVFSDDGMSLSATAGDDDGDGPRVGDDEFRLADETCMDEVGMEPPEPAEGADSSGGSEDDE